MPTHPPLLKQEKKPSVTTNLENKLGSRYISREKAIIALVSFSMGHYLDKLASLKESYDKQKESDPKKAAETWKNMMKSYDHIRNFFALQEGFYRYGLPDLRVIK